MSSISKGLIEADELKVTDKRAAPRTPSTSLSPTTEPPGAISVQTKGGTRYVDPKTKRYVSAPTTPTPTPTPTPTTSGSGKPSIKAFTGSETPGSSIGGKSLPKDLRSWRPSPSQVEKGEEFLEKLPLPKKVKAAVAAAGALTPVATWLYGMHKNTDKPISRKPEETTPTPTQSSSSSSSSSSAAPATASQQSSSSSSSSSPSSSSSARPEYAVIDGEVRRVEKPQENSEPVDVPQKTSKASDQSSSQSSSASSTKPSDGWVMINGRWEPKGTPQTSNVSTTPASSSGQSSSSSSAVSTTPASSSGQSSSSSSTTSWKEEFCRRHPELCSSDTKSVGTPAAAAAPAAEPAAKKEKSPFRVYPTFENSSNKNEGSGSANEDAPALTGAEVKSLKGSNTLAAPISKAGLKSAGKLVGKYAIPFAGVGIGAADAAERYKKGDTTGAAISGLSAASSAFPGIGSYAISPALDALNVARDVAPLDKESLNALIQAAKDYKPEPGIDETSYQGSKAPHTKKSAIARGIKLGEGAIGAGSKVLGKIGSYGVPIYYGTKLGREVQKNEPRVPGDLAGIAAGGAAGYGFGKSLDTGGDIWKDIKNTPPPSPTPPPTIPEPKLSSTIHPETGKPIVLNKAEIEAAEKAAAAHAAEKFVATEPSTMKNIGQLAKRWVKSPKGAILAAIPLAMAGAAEYFDSDEKPTTSTTKPQTSQPSTTNKPDTPSGSTTGTTKPQTTQPSTSQSSGPKGGDITRKYSKYNVDQIDEVEKNTPKTSITKGIKKATQEHINTPGGMGQSYRKLRLKPDNENNVINEDDLIRQIQQIADLNKIADINKIYAGKELHLPDNSTYVIQPGDTLTKIARNLIAPASTTLPTVTVNTTRPSYTDYEIDKRASSTPIPSIPGDKWTSDTLNNPGNLRYYDALTKKGYVLDKAVGSGSRGSNQGFAAFATPEEGLEAMRRQIEIDRKRGLTGAEMIAKYAPEADRNNVKAYINNVFTSAGIDPNKPINPKDIPEIQRRMIRQELGSKGYKYYYPDHTEE